MANEMVKSRQISGVNSAQTKSHAKDCVANQEAGSGLCTADFPNSMTHKSWAQPTTPSCKDRFTATSKQKPAGCTVTDIIPVLLNLTQSATFSGGNPLFHFDLVLFSMRPKLFHGHSRFARRLLGKSWDTGNVAVESLSEPEKNKCKDNLKPEYCIYKSIV
jgi:hypothetical protein